MREDRYRVMKERFADDMDALEALWVRARSGEEAAAAFFDAFRLVVRDEASRHGDEDAERKRQQISDLFDAMQPHLARLIDHLLTVTK